LSLPFKVYADFPFCLRSVAWYCVSLQEDPFFFPLPLKVRCALLSGAFFPLPQSRVILFFYYSFVFFSLFYFFFPNSVITPKEHISSLTFFVQRSPFFSELSASSRQWELPLLQTEEIPRCDPDRCFIGSLPVFPPPSYFFSFMLLPFSVSGLFRPAFEVGLR